MNTSTFSLVTADGSTVDYVLLDYGNGSFSTMTKAQYDAQQANQTLPSNSSIPQAGE